MKLMDLNDFKKQNLFKVNITYNEDLEFGEFDYLEYASKKFFNIIDDDYDIINLKFPLLNYNNEITNELLNNYKLDDDNVYNHPKYNIDFLNIKTRYDALEKLESFPKFTYSKSDAKENLKFPIIGKQFDSTKSQGIIRFDNILEFNANNDKLDIFQEYIKHREEYSMIVFKGQIILFINKRPLNNKAFKLVGSITDDSKFNHEQYDLKQIPVLFLDLIDEITKKYPKLDLYSINVIKHEHGINLTDLNVKPVLYFNSMIQLYYLIFKDFYKKDLNGHEQLLLKQYSNDLNLKTIYTYNNFEIK